MLSNPLAPHCHPETDTPASTYGITLLSPAVPQDRGQPPCWYMHNPRHTPGSILQQAWGSDLAPEPTPPIKGHQGLSGRYLRPRAPPLLSVPSPNEQDCDLPSQCSARSGRQR